MAAAKKGRESRKSNKSAEDDGSGLVEQALSAEEIKGRQDELISWLVKQEQTETKKSAAVKKFNADLKLADEKIRVLTREIDTGKAYVDPQTSMFPEEQSNDSQAAAS